MSTIGLLDTILCGSKAKEGIDVFLTATLTFSVVKREVAALFLDLSQQSR